MSIEKSVGNYIFMSKFMKFLCLQFYRNKDKSPPNVLAEIIRYIEPVRKGRADKRKLLNKDISYPASWIMVGADFPCLTCSTVYLSVFELYHNSKGVLKRVYVLENKNINLNIRTKPCLHLGLRSFYTY